MEEGKKFYKIDPRSWMKKLGQV